MLDRLVVADINLSQYRHNIRQIIKLVSSKTKVMAIVKANAYGHGLERTAKAAVEAGAECLGVVSLGELKRIRYAGISAPVLLLNYIDPASIADVIEYRGTISIMDVGSVGVIESVAREKQTTVKIHIKVDTGMHRAGCSPDDVMDIAQAIIDSPHLELEGLFTHFAESEAVDTTFSLKQLDVFTQVLTNLKNSNIDPPLIHCSNSAATLAMPESHFSMVRVGLLGYGLNPFPSDHPKLTVTKQMFKPVLSLKTIISQISTVEPGESVGYGRSWTASRRSRIALLPIGYGDGYRRSPDCAQIVIVGGCTAKIVGRISMDQTSIDITDIEEEVAIGDEVIVIGEKEGCSITVDDIAHDYRTINYEVVTSLSDRVARRYI